MIMGYICRTRLARPNSQARMGTAKYNDSESKNIYNKDRLAIAIRSLKDRCVTIVSLTQVLVLCVVGVWFVVLASSSTPYGKVPHLILKKTSRLTQAVVVPKAFPVRRVVV